MGWFSKNNNVVSMSGNGKVIINGVKYDVPKGASVSISNNKVIVNGKDITDEHANAKELVITIHGDVEKADVDNNLTIYGAVSNANAGNNLHIEGDVTGNACSGNNLKAETIHGNASAGNNVYKG